MVILGPNFPHGADEAFLLSWQPTTVVSFGRDFTVLLPTGPAAWNFDKPTRKPVSLAVSGDRTFVCVDGGQSPQHFFQCYVDLNTGEVVEGRALGIAAFTTSWEIVALDPRLGARSILKVGA
ncbi:MAG: hypothetical protein JWP35_1611 [Caulobacter sp.]|nr:hypothetical protein [Caulobacter sp.]